MIFFWDTSAVVNAWLNPDVFARLNDGQRHVSRSHVLAEFFSRMTGRGLRSTDADGNVIWVSITADDAVAWLDTFAALVSWVDLDTAEVMKILHRAQASGIMGGRVYDYLHAEAAKKAKADVVLTRNLSDFNGLVGSAKLEWP